MELPRYGIPAKLFSHYNPDQVAEIGHTEPLVRESYLYCAVANQTAGCKDTGEDGILISASNQADEDGSDIITASIGRPSNWGEDAWSGCVCYVSRAKISRSH